VAARLKVDENLPREIADLLNAHGYDAVTLLDQGWSGVADDDLWERIQAEGRWLVTADKEFADLRLFPPGTHAGVVLLRSDEEGLDDYLRLAGAAVERFELDEIAGAVVVVNKRGVRIRRAPSS
jgi:predicted nuclease of predicted toxin-antitoxin system